LIAGIKTDSRLPGEPKDPEGSALFQIFQAFATDDETAALRKSYAEGIAWGDAKQILFERIDREIAPMRERYQHLMDHPEEVQAMLLAGAAKARRIATPFIATLRHSVGLRALESNASAAKSKTTKGTTASFKQYREQDGKFYFKLVDPKGAVLLQSLGFASPKDAGQCIAQLREQGPTSLGSFGAMLAPMDDAANNAAISALRDLNPG